MTVILLLLFIGVFLGIDAIRQMKAKHAHFAIPQEMYFHESVGFSMADGGEKIEEEKTETKKG